MKLNELYDKVKQSGSEEQAQVVENIRFRLELAECKALYHFGDYKECLKLVTEHITKLEAAYPDAKGLGDADKADSKV